MDRDLVELAQRGDRDAFAVLVRTHADRLFGIARRILRHVDLADDAVQQALVVAWRELPSLRDADKFTPWTTRILVRICYESSRSSRLTAVNVVPLEAAGSKSSSDIAADVALSDQLERAFRRLPPEQRAILVLRHFVGLEPTEIADTLGVPAGTIRSRLHYAHREMRAAIEADDRPAVGGGIQV